MKRTLAVCMMCILGFSVQLVGQDDICADLFKQGYYDVHHLFTDQRNFQYLQDVICSDTTLTKQQADSKTFASGGTYTQAISGFLNAADQQKSFEEQRTLFCGMHLDTSTASSQMVTYTRTISKAATDTMKACFERSGFHAAVVPSRNLGAFTIKMKNVSEGDSSITVENISHSEAITCNINTPHHFNSTATIGCTKAPDKTVQISMVTNRGDLDPVDVLGTDTVIPDMQKEIKDLTDKIAALESNLQKVKDSLVFSNLFTVTPQRTVTNNQRSQPSGLAGNDGFCFMTHLVGPMTGGGQSVQVDAAGGATGTDTNAIPAPEMGFACVRFKPPFSNQ